MYYHNIYLILLFVLSTTGTFAQGRIVTVDNEIIQVVITEVTPEYIVYTLVQDDGIQYKIDKTQVKELVLCNEELGSLIIEKSGFTIHFSKQRGKYFIKGQDLELLTFKELGPFFIKDPYYRDLFLKSEKHRLNANVYGVLTLFSIAGGVVFINAGLNQYRTNFRSVTIGVLLAVLGTPSIGVTAIIDRVNYQKYKKELEVEYGINDFSSIPSFHNQKTIHLNLGFTQNGVGLFIQL